MHRMGHCASVMDYCRYNYVAQPEDKIALEDLVPLRRPVRYLRDSLGLWCSTAEHTTSSEARTLDEWASAQDTVPRVRYEGDEELGGATRVSRTKPSGMRTRSSRPPRASRISSAL